MAKSLKPLAFLSTIKKQAIPFAVTVALSMGVWLLLWRQTPETPPTQGETAVIVGVCAAVVIGTKLAYKAVTKIVSRRRSRAKGGRSQ
jgi:adenine/guanine phosphoribosyltransferase-like PRPP-binding protein